MCIVIAIIPGFFYKYAVMGSIANTLPLCPTGDILNCYDLLFRYYLA